MVSLSESRRPRKVDRVGNASRSMPRRGTLCLRWESAMCTCCPASTCQPMPLLAAKCKSPSVSRELRNQGSSLVASRKMALLKRTPPATASRCASVTRCLAAATKWRRAAGFDSPSGTRETHAGKVEVVDDKCELDSSSPGDLADETKGGDADEISGEILSVGQVVELETGAANMVEGIVGILRRTPAVSRQLVNQIQSS